MSCDVMQALCRRSDALSLSTAPGNGGTASQAMPREAAVRLLPPRGLQPISSLVGKSAGAAPVGSEGGPASITHQISLQAAGQPHSTLRSTGKTQRLRPSLQGLASSWPPPQPSADTGALSVVNRFSSDVSGHGVYDGGGRSGSERRLAKLKQPGGIHRGSFNEG